MANHGVEFCSETVDAVHNSWWIVRVCEVKDSTVFASELHDWLRSLTISREYSYGVSTDKHDSATVALRIRQRPITTTIRHDTPRMF